MTVRTPHGEDTAKKGVASYRAAAARAKPRLRMRISLSVQSQRVSCMMARRLTAWLLLFLAILQAKTEDSASHGGNAGEEGMLRTVKL